MGNIQYHYVLVKFGGIVPRWQTIFSRFYPNWRKRVDLCPGGKSQILQNHYVRFVKFGGIVPRWQTIFSRFYLNWRKRVDLCPKGKSQNIQYHYVLVKFGG